MKSFSHEPQREAGATPLLLPDEIWRDIPGYEGKYLASSLGRIRSLDREVKVSRGKTCCAMYYPGRILKPNTTSTRSYQKVSTGHHVDREVHTLVAAAFLGPCPEGCEVLHMNGNRQDNRPENLRYDTHAENLHDIYYQGSKAKKLDIEQVFQIRFGLVAGLLQEELAAMYGVSRHTISDIKCGKTFQWLKPDHAARPTSS